MAKTLLLRALSRAEQRLLAAKIRDLSLSARVHQRYRVIEEVRRGRAMPEAAERVGCHFTVAYDWVHRFNESGFATFEQVSNEGSAGDPQGRAVARAGRGRPVQPRGTGAAVFQLVGAQAGRVLPCQAPVAAGDRRVGAPVAAPRGPECAAHPYLEALA